MSNLFLAQSSEFLRGYLELLKSKRSAGVILLRMNPRTLQRNIKPRKLHIPLNDSYINDIDEGLNKFYKEVSGSYEDMANWFISEITDKTGELTNQYKTVSDDNFLDRKKTIVYFDADLKDLIKQNKFVDEFDITSNESKKAFLLEKRREIYDEILKTQPLYVSFSGNGFHIGYLLDEKVYDIDRYEKAYKNYTERLKKITGLVFDPKCTNPARIDRLPWTYNVKSDDPRTDSISECLYQNWDAPDTFMSDFRLMLSVEQVKDKLKSSKTPNTIYNLLPKLKIYDFSLYNYVYENISFKKVFDYFDLTTKLQYREPTKESDGFMRCYTPFREEQLPSFGYDENTKLFFDFGDIPNVSGSGSKGDAAGLAYGLFYFFESGKWPTIIAAEEAKEVLLKILGDKTEQQLKREITSFQTDERGRIVADFSMVLGIFLNYITTKYEVVFGKQQEYFMFRRRGSLDNFEIFPWACPEFGNKTSSTIAQVIFSACGVNSPGADLKSVGKSAIEYLTDKSSLRLDYEDSEDAQDFMKDNRGVIFCHYDHAAVEKIKLPVLDISQPVFRFKNGIYYKVKTGEIVSDFTGFSYYIPVDFEPVSKELEAPYWDTLLTGLSGPAGSPERQVLDYVFAQMWIPAHGDSRALVIRGDGRNGKSSLASVMEKLLPRGTFFTCNMGIISGNSSTAESARMNFIGKHLILVADMAKYDIDNDLKLIITGDGGVTARNLFQNAITFRNMATFILMANSMPIINDDTSAFIRRFLVIESRKIVTKPIENIDMKIVKNESKAVWQYIVRCIEKYRKYNFVFPEYEPWAQEVILPMRRALMSKVSGGEIILNLEPKAGSVVSMRGLYDVYVAYCEKTQQRKLQYKSFVDKVQSNILNNIELSQLSLTDSFKEVEMPDGLIAVLRNSQLEALINAKFDSTLLGVSNINVHVDMIDVFKEYNKKFDSWYSYDNNFKSTPQLKLDLSQTPMFKMALDKYSLRKTGKVVDMPISGYPSKELTKEKAALPSEPEAQFKI